MFGKPLVVRKWVKPDRIVTIEIRQVLPALVLIGLSFWYLSSPSAPALMMLLAIGGMILGSVLWAWTMATRVNVFRQLRSSVMQLGDELEEVIYLANHSILPVIWVEFVDHSEIPGYTLTSIRAADPFNTQQWRAHTICSRRGLFSLGPWEIIMGDVFGFFKIHQLYTQKHEILVYPPLAALPPEIIPRGGTLGEQRSLRQSISSETVHAMATRAYLPGDPIRHFHWKSTAHKDTPIVKMFEPESASRIWLAPDFDAAVHIGTGAESTEETMVLMTASLAAHLLQQGMAVGLFASAQTDEIILPARGGGQIWSILKSLAPLHPVQDRPLRTMLDRLNQVVPGRDLMILVTPSVNPDWINHLNNSRKARVGGGSQVILLDPESFGGTGNSGSFALLLAEMNVTARTIRMGEVRPMAEAYGSLARWEFVTVGTGKAVARRSPRKIASVLQGAPQSVRERGEK